MARGREDFLCDYSSCCPSSVSCFLVDDHAGFFICRLIRLCCFSLDSIFSCTCLNILVLTHFPVLFLAEFSFSDPILFFAYESKCAFSLSNFFLLLFNLLYPNQTCFVVIFFAINGISTCQLVVEEVRHNTGCDVCLGGDGLETKCLRLILTFRDQLETKQFNILSLDQSVSSDGVKHHPSGSKSLFSGNKKSIKRLYIFCKCNVMSCNMLHQ